MTKSVPQAASYTSCVGTISSLSDVDAAVQCTTVNVYGFTVPAGQTFSLDLLRGSTVNILGDFQFGNKSWSGPFFKIIGEDITFNGNGHLWDGGGSFYWDGLGGSGGLNKPSPMMQILITGTMSGVHVINSPERCFSINSFGQLVLSDIIVDDSQGALPNTNSKGLPAGRNTDGFDVSGNDIVIKNSTVINQDDCLAINKGKNIVFEDNYCEGGHGISIGSISSNVVVENVIIQGNIVVDSANGFRIKTKKAAINSSVSNITYSANTARNCTNYGVLVTQSYPESTGTPGNGVTISDIRFNQGTTDVSVASNADMVVLDCGEGSCYGSWDFSGLTTSGGKVGQITNNPHVTGYPQ
ncbi:glycoside hydrolase [Butyriboletus roseoflavus]|nr:glycoside hydrolase [Butyriboletus roseoflavus]